MKSNRNISRKTLRNFIAAAVGAAMGGGALLAVITGFLPGLGPPSGGVTRPGAWKVLAGALEESADPQSAGPLFTARGWVRLERDGVSVALAPGSRVDIQGERISEEGMAVPLPSLTGGAMKVSTRTQVTLDGLLLEPRGEAQLAITPEAITVIEGAVEHQRQLLSRGEAIARAIARPLARALEPLKHLAEISGAAAAAVSPSGGRVIDARDGRPVAGAELRFVFSYSDDGYPPLPGIGSRGMATTGADGAFSIPVFRPDDPRLKVHIEVNHPDYLPKVHVIEEEPDIDGRWPFVTLALRLSLTERIFILDPGGQPFAGAAVEVERSPGSRFIGEDSWEEGRTVRPDRPLIRYAAADGSLRFGLEPVTLVLRDPLLHIWDPDLRQPQPRFGADLDPGIRAGRAPESRWEVFTRRGESKVYQILDRNGAPIPEALIEIKLSGMPAVRLTTGPRGEFTFAPRPFLEHLPRLSPENPRRGEIQVLSPLLWKHRIPVALPSRSSQFLAAVAAGGRLEFRARAAGPEAPRPIPADGVRIDRDLTLVRRTPSGEAAFEGILPPGTSELAILLDGWLPREVTIPQHLPAVNAIDLGEILFERGGEAVVRLAGGDAGIHGRARMRIADEKLPFLAQQLRFDPTGRAVAGGLVEGRTYLYSVEGSWIEPVEGAFAAGEEIFRDGLEVPLVSIRQVEVLLRGEVTGVQPEEAVPYRVVERFYFEGEEEPVAFGPYPLPPDRLIGSRRTLRPPRRAEVFVIGPDFMAGAAARDRSPGRWEFDLGLIHPEVAPHAFFTFRAGELGRVAVPRGLSLFAERNLNHEVARMFPGDEELMIENLLPGRYALRWGGGGEEQEMFAFTVGDRQTEVRAEIPRRPQAVETLLVRLVDPEGKPVAGAEIALEGGFEPGGDGGEAASDAEGPATGRRSRFPPAGRAGPRPEAGGLYRVAVRSRQENRVRIAAQDFLAARVFLPPGRGFPEPVVLQRGARGRGMFLDAAGRRLAGSIEVTWREGEAAGVEASVLHGAPFTAALQNGILESGLFPPGARRFSFRLAASEARAERDLDILPRVRNDLGNIRLEETRALEGTVFLPGGAPAPNASVALVEPERAHHYPQRPVDLEGLKYSARTDGLGRFRIDGLPIDLRRELALVAHLPGWTDAVEKPVDLDRRDRYLQLALETVLVIDAGYGDGRDREDYQFRLECVPAGAVEEDIVDLGPILPASPGGVVYRGITPGLYRLTWDLKERHPGALPRRIEAAASSGTTATLALRVNDRFLPGEAFFNGEPLASGWAIITDDPGNPAATRIARIAGGRIEAPVPARAEKAFAALIPDRRPLPYPDFYRGETLPEPVPDFRGALRHGVLNIGYTAYDLTIELSPRLLERFPDLEIEFPHYIWDGIAFRREQRAEPVRSATFRLHLLRAGPFSFRLTGRGGYRHLQNMVITKDTTIRIGG